MSDELTGLIKQTTKLPTLPSVATHIVKLANKPDASIAEVAKAVSMDPALASKLLRFANSSAYGMAKQVASVNRAIVIMGLKAVLNISLSFSLVSALKMQQAEGLNYTLFWRRSLLAGAAARVVGEIAGEKALEELFLAGLLQDIGMLALDRTDREFYDGLGEAQKDHARAQSYENALFDHDHTYVGHWLLRRWGLPERTVRAVEHSHDRSPLPGSDKDARFINCVILSGHVADVYVNPDAQGIYSRVATMARAMAGLDQKQLMKVLERTGALVKSLEKLFDIKFIEGDGALDVLAAANEALMLRSVEALQKSAKPEPAAAPAPAAAAGASAAAATGGAEDKWRDALTGAPNREFLDHYLQEFFSRTRGNSEKLLSLAIANLDGFGKINEMHGSDVGNLILKASYLQFKGCVRTGDVVARIGGDNFAILMPGASASVAADVCERIVDALDAKLYTLQDRQKVRVTASLGVVTHGSKRLFTHAGELVRAASFAMAAAKFGGRGRLCVFDEIAPRH